MSTSHSALASSSVNSNVPANNNVAFIPASAVFIDESGNVNVNTAQNNSNAYGVASGQIVPSGSNQPATSYSLSTAAMVHDGFEPTSPQLKPQQYQQQTRPHHQNNGRVYATSFSGQPVLVSISPIATQRYADPELSAAHHENPVSKAIRRRRRRNRRAAIGGAAGIVTGAVLLGPFGILLGYAAGITIGSTSAVAGERCKDRRLARERQALVKRRQMELQ